VCLASYSLQRLLLSALCALIVVFVVIPMLLASNPTLSRYYNSFFYSINAPQTNDTISNSYVSLAQADAQSAGIPPDLFVRQINMESGFDPYAYSPAGAEGIAQFEPGTAAGLGIDPWNPVQALQGAADLMARYRQNYGGDYAKALAAYNGGSGRLSEAIQNCGPAWLSCEPAETRHYVHTILGY
jgi:soluble lytic murein transglycosylase-like protein